MPINISFAVGDTDYIQKLNDLIAAINGLSVSGNFNGTIVASAAGPHAFGGGTSSLYQFNFTGNYANAAGNQAGSLVLKSTINPGAGENASSFWASPGIVKAGSGTHVNFATAQFDAPTLTGGAAAVTNASTVKISGAPAGATNNYGLWAGGTSRFDGAVLAGTPSATIGGAIDAAGAITATVANSATYPFHAHNADAAGDNRFLTFGTEGTFTARGSIDFNRGGVLTRYNTTSDGSLKRLLGDADPQKSIRLLREARLRAYEWRHLPGWEQIGLVAQELQPVFPGAVSAGGVYVDGVGRLKYRPWMVDKTAFAFHLIAGWKDHEARLARAGL